MAVKDNYQLLIEKLDRFTRKYYINQLIRGSLYSVALILALFIVLNVLEYYFYFDTSIRKFLFYTFFASSSLAFIFWVLTPMLHYFNLGKIISHEQAAHIIGQHFTDVKDKLLNILQLKKQAESNSQTALLLASINQKTEEIKPIPFRSAINLGQNKKYLRFALPPLLLLLVLLFAAPSMIKESTTRLINNNVVYEREAPFHFVIEKENLSVVQFSDYLLKVAVKGDLLPNEVFINIDNYHYRLTKDHSNQFSYKFSNVQKNTDFQLFASDVKSEKFTLDVLKKPNILGFEVKLDFPAYTQRKDHSIANIGDLVIPVGTKIDWVFNAQNTDDISIRFNGSENIVSAERFDNELFTHKKQALKDETYKIIVSNKNLPKADSVAYSINVIPDLFPTISVEQFIDSVENNLLYFVGDAADDYGLLSLSFNYQIVKSNGSQSELNTLKLNKPDGKQIQYDHIWDISTLELQPGDQVTYFFEVYDNDAVNGNKSSRTNIATFKKPTAEEYEEMESKNNEEIQKNLQESLKETKDIQNELKKLREKLLQEKELDWQTRKDLEELLERQKELEQKIEEAKKNFEENINNQGEFSQPNEELLEKQEQVQKLFEELMSDEMKDLIKQIEDLLQELEKDGALDMLEEMQFGDEELELELDRMLELLKQLEVENELQKQINQLEELAKEQEQLSEETEKNAESDEQGVDKEKQEELEKKQEDINEKFDKLEEKMDKLQKKNEELERPNDLGNPEEKMEDIQQDLDDSKEQLQQKQNKNASKSQKQAAQKMKEMAQAMAMQMQSGQMEQMEEDMEALRQLLENLIGLSFDQEELMNAFTTSEINTPHYTGLVQNQYKLKDDFGLIEDSLQALSKRVFQIESFITEKVSEIKSNLRDGISQLEERKIPFAAKHQQVTMKNVNDLALMLNEVMEQMQQQMSGMMAGSQMCNKPGGKGQQGRKPMDQIGQGQQDLNQQLQQLKEGLKNGQPGSSKEFAQMAAKQAALRKALRELAKEKQQQGQGDKELQDIIDQMNKVEIDLVNKKLSNETLQRQKEILTRLLEAEKSEREREYDQKRKAEVASLKERKMPPSLEEYIKKREAEIEMYKTVSPTLKPFYKYLVEEYFKSLKGQD